MYINYRVMPPKVTAPKHMPAQPRSHAPTTLRPLVGNSDIVFTALVVVERVKRTACHGDICNSTVKSRYIELHWTAC